MSARRASAGPERHHHPERHRRLCMGTSGPTAHAGRTDRRRGGALRGNPRTRPPRCAESSWRDHQNGTFETITAAGTALPTDYGPLVRELHRRAGAGVTGSGNSGIFQDPFHRLCKTCCN